MYIMISAADSIRPPTLPQLRCRRRRGRDVSGKSPPQISLWVSPLSLFWLCVSFTLRTRLSGLNPGIILATATATAADAVERIDSEGSGIKVWEDDDDDFISLSNKTNQMLTERQSSLSEQEKRNKSLPNRPDDDEKDNEDDSVAAASGTVQENGNIASATSIGKQKKHDEDKPNNKIVENGVPLISEDGKGDVSLDVEEEDPDANSHSLVEFDGFGAKPAVELHMPHDDEDGGAVIASANTRNSQDVAATGQFASFESVNDGGSLIHPGDYMPPSSHHRNQSSEGDRDDADTGGDSEAKAIENSQNGSFGAKSEPEERARFDPEATEEVVSHNIMASGEAKVTSGGNVENGAGQINPDETIGTGTDQIPQLPNNAEIPIEGYPFGDDDDEEDSYFEMVKSTFNIIVLAAFFTLLLVFRKRVGDRISTDSSISTPVAIRDELIDVIVQLSSLAISRTGGGGSGSSSSGTSGVGVMTSSVSSGPEAIPLSTATDEEWGWEDDEVGANLELSGLGGGDVKEDDDLAMAIAMSLSEADSGGLAGEKKTIAPAPRISSISHPPLSAKTSLSANIHTRSFSEHDSTKNMQKMNECITPSPAVAIEGNSIEDLLGQMGGAGGAAITSFGQRTNPAPKANPRNESSDDIFASMGLSSFPSSRPAGAGTPVTPTSGGWQAPSLLADTIDDEDADADWGDDGDLDDLLDD